jgi:hypothetical protein
MMQAIPTNSLQPETRLRKILKGRPNLMLPTLKSQSFGKVEPIRAQMAIAVMISFHSSRTLAQPHTAKIVAGTANAWDAIVLDVIKNAHTFSLVVIPHAVLMFAFHAENVGRTAGIVANICNSAGRRIFILFVTAWLQLMDLQLSIKDSSDVKALARDQQLDAKSVLKRQRLDVAVVLNAQLLIAKHALRHN